MTQQRRLSSSHLHRKKTGDPKTLVVIQPHFGIACLFMLHRYLHSIKLTAYYNILRDARCNISRSSGYFTRKGSRCAFHDSGCFDVSTSGIQAGDGRSSGSQHSCSFNVSCHSRYTEIAVIPRLEITGYDCTIALPVTPRVPSTVVFFKLD